MRNCRLRWCSRRSGDGRGGRAGWNVSLRRSLLLRVGERARVVVIVPFLRGGRRGGGDATFRGGGVGDDSRELGKVELVVAAVGVELVSSSVQF